MCRRCNCNYNNNYPCNSVYKFNEDLIEEENFNHMQLMNNFYDDTDDFECGFDEEYNSFPTCPMYGQSYVPIQNMNKTFTPCAGLKMGTIFPELVSPYYPGLSIEQINYIKNNNSIKEGYNS